MVRFLGVFCVTMSRFFHMRQFLVFYSYFSFVMFLNIPSFLVLFSVALLLLHVCLLQFMYSWTQSSILLNTLLPPFLFTRTLLVRYLRFPALYIVINVLIRDSFILSVLLNLFRLVAKIFLKLLLYFHPLISSHYPGSYEKIIIVTNATHPSF